MIFLDFVRLAYDLEKSSDVLEEAQWQILGNIEKSKEVLRNLKRYREVPRNVKESSDILGKPETSNENLEKSLEIIGNYFSFGMILE